MESQGITHILSLGVQPKSQPAGLIEAKLIDIEDSFTDEIYPHLPTAVDYISQAINSGGKILVHCVYGKSRSGSCVIAYIMNSKKMNYDDALAFVKSKRKKVMPNLTFVR